MFDYMARAGYSSPMSRDLLTELRERIVSPEFPAGAALSEKALAEEFQVSRTPIREALIRLTAEGLVTSAPGHGFSVKEFSIREFREISEIRWQLASLVGRLAAERRTAAELEALEALYEEIEEGEDLETLHLHDVRFHNVIDGATHNTALIKQKALLLQQFSRIRYSLGPGVADGYFSSLKDDVGAFLEGLRKRDGEACTEVLQKHLRRFVDQVFSTDW